MKRFAITIGLDKNLFLADSFSTSLNHFHQLAQIIYLYNEK